MARTTRTLGTLISSGVPILEALAITRETSGNAMFERLYQKVNEAIRQGETIAKPLKANSVPGFHPMALFFWCLTGIFPGVMVLSVAGTAGFTQLGKNPGMVSTLLMISIGAIVAGIVVATLLYLMKMRGAVVDDLVVNMVDVGEETGELDTMLYKVADTFDEEVRTMTDGMTKLIEPILIVFLGCSVGFIVVALFMPLIKLITSLGGGG
jgi:type IV pilus assembly protein PilC